MVALVSKEASDSFLGTQGDPWDTQTDMALAFAGAILALVTLARLHDAQLARIASAAPPP
jgi:putative membrane protein